MHLDQLDDLLKLLITLDVPEDIARRPHKRLDIAVAQSSVTRPVVRIDYKIKQGLSDWVGITTPAAESQLT